MTQILRKLDGVQREWADLPDLAEFRLVLTVAVPVGEDEEDRQGGLVSRLASSQITTGRRWAPTDLLGGWFLVRPGGDQARAEMTNIEGIMPAVTASARRTEGGSCIPWYHVDYDSIIGKSWSAKLAMFSFLLQHREHVDRLSRFETIAQGLIACCRLLPQQLIWPSGQFDWDRPWPVVLLDLVAADLHPLLVLRGGPVSDNGASTDGTAQRANEMTAHCFVLERDVRTALGYAIEAARDLACEHEQTLPGEGAAPSGRKKKKKKGAPIKRDLKLDRRLMQDWGMAKGVGGQTRTEFCREKDIELDDFIKAQDNVRKHLNDAK